IIVIEVVHGLLRHRERAGHRNFDEAIRTGTQERHIANLDGMHAPNLADDARHDVWSTAAAGSLSWIVQVDAVERGGEAIDVALAADLTVAQDVDAGALHIANSQHRRVVLGLLEERLGNAPDILRPDSR